jgi:Rad3-related DNA helicase
MKKEDIKQFFPWESYRDHQEETIINIIDAFDAGYEVVILRAPVGFGKSPVGVTLGKIFKSTYYTTPQKMLQDQLFKDFSGKDFAVVKGRGNFNCNNNREKCDYGLCKLKNLK